MATFSVRATALALALPLVASLSAAPAGAEEPPPNKGRDYIAMLFVPMTGAIGADQRQRAERNATKFYYLGEAACVGSSFEQWEGVLDDLDAAHRLLPVTFGAPENPKDPISEARQTVFGTPKLTDKVRRGLCDSLAVRNRYHDTLRDLIARYGQQLKPDYAEANEDELAELFHDRLFAYAQPLKPWLPVDIFTEG